MAEEEMKKKKIIIVYHTGVLCGGTKSLIDVAVMLNSQYDVYVCFPVGFCDFVKQLKDNNINYIQVEYAVPYLTGYSGGPFLFSAENLKSICSLRNIKRFCKDLEKYCPDVVIFNNIVTSIIAKDLDPNIKKICFDRETIVSSFYRNIYGILLKRHFDGIIFLAESERRKFNLKKDNTCIIPDTMFTDTIKIEDKQIARNRENLPKNSFTILYMGGSALLKGPDVILKAFADLGTDFELIVAGKFTKNHFSIRRIVKYIIYPRTMIRIITLRTEYKRSLKKENIIFVGNREDISGLLNAADVIVFPSFNVHQPRPCIEAGFYYKPVIISDFLETQEYFINGYNAITFKPGNYKDLKRSILSAKNHREDLIKIGENNHAMSIKKHNCEKIQKDLRDFIKKVVER